MVRQAAEVTLCIRLRLRPPRSWLGGSVPQMASSSSTSTSTTSSAVPRALISRERVPKSNTGKYKERGNSDPKNMSPRDRIEEFPRENLYICDAKDCKTGRWTIRMFIKVKIDRVKLQMIFIFLKISVKSK